MFYQEKRVSDGLCLQGAQSVDGGGIRCEGIIAI